MTPATSNLDHWEHQYVRRIDPKYLNTIAWTDPEAVGRYPKYNWIYDKYELSERVGVSAWDLEREEPDRYPVFIKPRYNLWGMGERAYKASHPNKILSRDGMIAQEYFKGGHISTDFVIFDSEVVDHFSFVGHTNDRGSFILWESTRKYGEDAYFLAKMVAESGIGHCIMNVETIRGRVIEAHLRPSIQFFDICGRLINQAMACFYRDKEYVPRAREFEKTYSQVSRMYIDAIPILKYTPKKIPGVRSVQCCWEHNLPLSACAQDKVSYRYLTINGNDLDAIQMYGLKFTEAIAFQFPLNQVSSHTYHK